MSILDYGQALNNAPNPMQGFMQSASQTQGLMNNAQVMNQRGKQNRLQEQERMQTQQAQARMPARLKEATDIMLGDDYKAQAAYMLNNQDVAKQFEEAMKIKDEGAKADRISFNGGIVASTTDPRPAIRQRIIEKNAAGENTENLQATLALESDEEIRSELRKELNFLDAKGMIDYDEASGASEDGQQLSADMNAFNELIKDMTPEQQKTAREIKAGLKGRAITNAEMTAIQDGSINSYADYKTRQKEREKFAEATGASRARIIDKSFEKIGKIDASIGNIDRAINAINNGAGTGVIEKHWPSIKAASVELENIRNSMALDVVGATTFGALSQGELDLAKDVALPTGLDGPELLEYLGKKRDAQNKLKTQYEDLLQHLDQGGTEASFVRMKKREAGQAQPNQQPAQQEPQQVQQTDFSNMTDEELFN